MKLFTLCVLACLSFSLESFSQAQKGVKNKIPMSGAATVATKAHVGDKAEVKNASEKLAVARFVSNDFLKALSADEAYLKRVVVVSDQFILDYNELTPKAEEILKMLAEKNSGLPATELIVNYLPKIGKFDSQQEIVSTYHAQLELLMQTYPSLMQFLGESFSKVFNTEEAFSKAVFEAMEKGHVLS